VSLSLAMTACVTLISAKANAASVTFAMEGGNKPKEPGEWVSFIITLDPGKNKVWYKNISDKFSFDGKELAHDSSKTVQHLKEDSLLIGPEVIATLAFSVREGVEKDDKTDLWDVEVFFKEEILDKIVETSKVSETIIDVVPVPEQPTPEPLTMLGAAAALGYGAILKRESSKKKEI